MRITRLAIERFGFFADEAWTLNPHLQLIHGRNEAGKTTLLNFIRKMLFGFDHREAYQFVAGTTIAGEMSAQLRSGRTLTFRRRKGRQDEIVGQLDDGTPIDARGFDNLRGVSSETLYQRIFAFTLDDLAHAENLATDDVASLLTEGLRDLRAMRTLRDELQKQADELFTPKATSRPKLTAKLNAIGETSNELSRRMTSPDDFAALTTRREALRRQRDAAVQQRRQHQRSISEADELLRAHRLYEQWAATTAQRDAIELPPNLPHDAGPAFEAARKRRQADRQRLDEADRKLHAAEVRLASYTIDEAVLEQGDAIAALARRLIAAEQADRERTGRAARHDAERAQVIEDAAALGLDWSLSALAAWRLPPQTRADWRIALDTYEQAEADERSAATAMAEQRERLQRIKAALARLSDVSDDALADLQAVVAQGPRVASLAEKRRTAAARARTNQLKRDERLRRLVGSMAVEEAVSLRVPPRPTIESQIEQLDEADDARRQAEQRSRAAAAEVERLQGELAELDATIRAPSADAIAMRRDQRDAAWPPIREAAVGRGEPIDEAQADAFARAIREVDLDTDRRLADVKALADRDAKVALLTRAEADRTQAAAALDAAATALQSVEASWRSLWSNVGVEPLSPPRAMLDWHDRWREAIERHEAWIDDSSALQQLEAELANIAQRVAATAGEEAIAIDDLDAALRRLEQRRDAMTQAIHQRDTLAQQKQEAVAAIARAEQQAARAQEAEPAAGDRLKAIGADLALPADWPIATLAETLAALPELAERARNVETSARELAEHEATLASFHRAADELREALAASIEDAWPADAFALVWQADQALQAARDLTATQREIRRQIEHDLQPERDAARQQVEQSQRAVAAMVSAAAMPDEAGLQRAIERQAEVQRLDATVEQLRQRLEGHRGGRSLDELLATLARTSAEALQSAMADDEAALHEVDEQITAIDRELGGIHTQVDTLQAASETATLSAELAMDRATAADLAERWMRLHAGIVLINACLERFTREHRPALLDATSRLFEQLTGGRYRQLRRAAEEGALLEAIRWDREPFRPSALSMGTRQLLFLAVRLAYVLNHAQTPSAEPMPLVIDDAFVNLDAPRLASTLTTLAGMSEHVQVIYLTCHDHVLEAVRERWPHAGELLLPRPPIGAK